MASDQNAIYLTGWTDGFVTTFGNVTIPGGEVFVASVDPSGSVNWVENIEGEGFANGIHSDGEYVYAAGRVTNLANIAGDIYSTNSGSADIYQAVFKANEYAGTGLVGYYTFDNGSLEDVSGNGNIGTMPNGGLFSVDRYGNGFSSFEPEDNATYIEINQGGSWDFSGAWTVSGWIRPNTFPPGNGGEERDVFFSNSGGLDIGTDEFGKIFMGWPSSEAATTILRGQTWGTGSVLQRGHARRIPTIE